MVAIPLPYASAPGFRAQEGAGRLINCYAEPLGEGRTDAKRVRVPGMTSYLTSPATGFRGMFLESKSGILYAAFKNSLYKGTAPATPPGALIRIDSDPSPFAGTKSVYFARNNAATPDIAVVTENNAFIVTPAGFSAYPDPDLPVPNSVFGLDGYLVFTIADGRAFASDLNSTAINALSFGTAEAKPDGLVRGIPFSGRALFFGTQSLEIWIDVGAQPFPFQRSTVTPFGLIGPDAVAGWEDGWGAGLIWVANDYTVRQLDGYSAQKVSTPDLDRLIARDPAPQSLLASVHMVDGHAMWTISGSTFTWEYDITTQKWHERASWLTNRWRGLQTQNAYNLWLIGDRNGGNIYSIDPTNHREANDPLRMRVESGPVEKFPAHVRVARADFKLDTGVGIATGSEPIQTDPTVEISWSDDGGITWSNPLRRKIGRQAKTDKLIQVFRTGMSTPHGRRWRLDLSDPVYTAILAGDQSAELR